MVEQEMSYLQEPMACQSWTFSGLIGAFVDLAIAYLLLCSSAVAFFASKFLAFIGLSLPCPCNGVFRNPNMNICLQQSRLINSPLERISSVQLSVKNKFPFGSTWERDRNYPLNMKLVSDKDSCVDGLLEIQGETSCNSVSGTNRKSNNGSRKDLVMRNETNTRLGVFSSCPDLGEGSFDFKGKGNKNQRPRVSSRRMRKVTDHGKITSVSEYCTSCSDGRSPYGINHQLSEVFECSSEPVASEVGLNQVRDDENQVLMNMEKSFSPGPVPESVDENSLAIKNMSSSEGLKGSGQIEHHFSYDQENTIRILEQALEQEHAARSALYLELEKERSAAATAADEAMAMILRLQEEKASVEMEARQFQRMIEEKSTYDSEEMNILKEIIMRRERENHFLEKEVEAYKALIYGGNTSAEIAFNLDVIEDPDMMLQQLSEVIDNHGILNDKVSVNEVATTSEQNYSFHVDKGVRGTHITSTSAEIGFDENVIIVSGEVQDKDNDFEPSGARYGETCSYPYPTNYKEVAIKSGETPDMIDVHVIDEKSHLMEGTSGEKSEDQLENDSVNVPGTCGVKSEPIRKRINSSDLIGLPPAGGPEEGKYRVSDLRRNSMSGLDNERVKIDSEVEWLRERLRIVQEGRDKLNFSLERQERELFQVQLLEDIACQLREIRQLTSPGKVVRHASLPLPPLKGLSKKRRHQSVSVGVRKT